MLGLGPGLPDVEDACATLSNQLLVLRYLREMLEAHQIHLGKVWAPLWGRMLLTHLCNLFVVLAYLSKETVGMLSSWMGGLLDSRLPEMNQRPL